MEENTTDIVENDVMDNSNVGIDDVVDNSEPVNTDNSDKQLQQEQAGEPTHNQDQQKPKFTTFEESLKGYDELEKRLGQQSNELGQLRKQVKEYQQKELELANKNGFETVEDFNNYQLDKQDELYLANTIADEYQKRLSQCNYPEDVAKMLNDYRSNPSDELLSEIESEFPVQEVKKLAILETQIKGQLEDKKNQALTEETKLKLEGFLNPIVEANIERFKNPAFAKLFGEGVLAYGTNLDVDRYISLIDDYAKSINVANNIKKGIDNDNKSATDEIAGLSFNNNSNNNVSNKSIDEMSDAELERLISKVI